MTKKKYCILPKNIKPLYPEDRGGGMVTDRVTVEGHPIRFMYRTESVAPEDSGWCFFSGVGEDDSYVNDPNNSSVMSLNTIANFDPTIIPFLGAPVGSVFEKIDDEFEAVDD